MIEGGRERKGVSKEEITGGRKKEGRGDRKQRET